MYDQFVAKSVELTSKRKMGDPFAEDVLQGGTIIFNSYFLVSLI